MPAAHAHHPATRTSNASPPTACRVLLVDLRGPGTHLGAARSGRLTAPRRPTRSASRTCACRSRTGSARRARASATSSPASTPSAILVASEVLGDGFLVHRPGREYAREREVFGTPHRPEPGRAIPARAGLPRRLRRPARAVAGGRDVRGRRATRVRGERGQAPWPPRRTGPAGNAAMDTFGGYGLRRGVRHRAQVPRGPAADGGAGEQQPDPRLHRPPGSRPAEPRTRAAAGPRSRRGRQHWILV